MKLTNYKFELGFFAAIIACIALSRCAHADTFIDTALVDKPDGTATALYGCETWIFDNGQIVLQCAASFPAFAYTPMSTHAPMVVFGALTDDDQFEYWPSTGACVLLSHTFGNFGQNQWEVSCGDVVSRSNFDE